MADRTDRILGWPLTRPGRIVSLLIVGVVAVWFALPAFSIAYTEGFQAEIVINAYALRQGNLRLGDTLYPFDGRFFLLTRLGTTLGVLALQSLGNLTGIAALQLIGIGSLAVLLAALLMLLWRVYRVGPALGLLCCILFPPIFEAAYLPNDNMPSAALVCVAVLLFWTNPTILRTVVTGLLLGVAVLLRLDAALIAPAFAILLLTEVRGWGARAVRACIAGGLVAATPIVAYRLCGLSFFDVPAVVDQGVRLWDRPQQALHNDLRTALLSFTALGGFAWLLGVVSFARLHRWRDLALAVAVPLFYVAAYRSQLVEARYLLPLSPFILLAVAEGLRSVAALPGRWRTVALIGLVAGFAVWIVPPPPNMPPMLLADDEGPRFVVGRAWNPLPTLWWQERLRAGQRALAAQVERLAATPDPAPSPVPGRMPSRVIVTGYWTGDRLATLALLEHGFVPQPDRTTASCRGIAESFSRNSVNLLQIRTHVPFVWRRSEVLTWEQVGLPCIDSAGSAPPGSASNRVLLVNSGPLKGLAAALDDPDLVFSAAHGRPPPLAPRLVSLLTGISIADLPVGDVSAAIGNPLPPEDQRAALDMLAQRAKLLR